MRRPHIALVLSASNIALTGATQLGASTTEDNNSIVSLRHGSNPNSCLTGPRECWSPRSKRMARRISLPRSGDRKIRRKDGDDDDNGNDSDEDGDDDHHEESNKDNDNHCFGDKYNSEQECSTDSSTKSHTSSIARGSPSSNTMLTTSSPAYTISTTTTTPTPTIPTYTPANSQSTSRSVSTTILPAQGHTGTDSGEATRQPTHDDDNRTAANIAAGVAGGVGGLLILVLALFAWYWLVIRRRRRQQSDMTSSKESNIESRMAAGLTNISPQLASQHSGGGSSGGESGRSNNSSIVGLSSHGMSVESIATRGVPIAQAPPAGRAELYNNNVSLERLPGMPPPAAMSQSSLAEMYAAQYGQIQQPHAYSPLMGGMMVTPGFLPPGSHGHYNHQHHVLSPLQMAASRSHSDISHGSPDPFDDRPPPPRYPDAIAAPQSQGQSQSQAQQEPRTYMSSGAENTNIRSVNNSISTIPMATTTSPTSPILPVSPLSTISPSTTLPLSPIPSPSPSPSTTALEDDAHIVPGGPPSNPQTHLYRGPRQPDYGSYTPSNLPEVAVVAATSEAGTVVVSPICQTTTSPPDYDESAESEAAAAAGARGDTKQAPPSREPMSRY